MEAIRSLFEDDPDMLDLVREFALELPSRANQLDGTFASADWPELQRLAHQMKGAGGGYGFPQITEAAGSLEQALKEGRAEPLLKDLTRALCRMLRAVAVPEVR